MTTHGQTKVSTAPTAKPLTS